MSKINRKKKKKKHWHVFNYMEGGPFCCDKHTTLSCDSCVSPRVIKETYLSNSCQRMLLQYNRDVVL